MNGPKRLPRAATMRGRLWLMAILAFTLAWPVSAETPVEKFHPRGDGDPVAGHYEVVLAGSEAGDDLPAIADELARAYGGRLEPFAEQGVRAFAIILSPARARMLSADGRVSAVIELAGRPSRENVPAVTPPEPVAPSGAVANKPLRPAVNGTGNWTSGTFAYDGAGNVKAIGSNVYVYDTVSRLVSGTVEGTANRQDYGYDSFGNRTATSRTGGGCVGGTDCEEAVTINSLTNRITSNGAVYDAAGDLTSFDSSYSYSYDGAGMLVRETAGGVDQQYLYTADDERIATIQGTGWTWTVRDLGGKVQRTFTSTNGTGTYGDTGFQWAEDYVWRDGLLLASESPSGTRHYHLDHLGTPRLVTNGSGVKIGFHSYYPFGAELAMTTTETPTELMKFTGHQRDLLAADVHTLDYMHARHFQFATGRFLSIDPIHGSLRAPQSWNRYAYVRNSPLVFADPRGMQQLVITGRTGDEADSSLIDPLSQTVNSFLSFHWALDIANSGINWVKAHPVQTGFYAANAALFVASDGSSAVAEAGAAEVIVDTNVLIAAIEGGEGATVDAALAGSTPVAPLTVISEYAVKGSAESASRWLLARGGRVVADVPASSAARLVGKAASAGRVLNAADARVAGAAAERGIGVLTRDIRLRGVLEVLGIKSTGF